MSAEDPEMYITHAIHRTLSKRYAEICQEGENRSDRKTKFENAKKDYHLRFRNAANHAFMRQAIYMMIGECDDQSPMPLDVREYLGNRRNFLAMQGVAVVALSTYNTKETTKA